MSRPKTIRINAATLKIWRDLSDELFDHPLFQKCNFDCVEIVSKEKYRNPYYWAAFVMLD